MLDLFLGPFADYAFLRRALVGCITLSISAAPVGVFLMLRRMSLMGDAMSHAILPGAAVGFLFAGLSVGAMTLGGLVAGCLVAVLSGFVARITATGEDSSLAAFYLIALSLGVIIISVNGSSIDLLHVLFGSALALNDDALLLLGGIASITIPVLLLLYRPLVLECFDKRFLSAAGGWGAVAHFAFLLLVVLNLVAGFHALGTLMSVGIMILPAAAARFWVRQLEHLILLAVVIAAGGCVVGLLISYYVDWPSGPLIILVLGIAYLLAAVFGLRGGILYRFLTLKHLEA